MNRLIFIVTPLILLIACKNKTDHAKTTAGAGTYNVQQLLVPLDSARQNILFFDTVSAAYVHLVDSVSGDTSKQSAVAIKAFTVRAEDLFAAMGLPAQHPAPRYDHIRVYLGYQQSTREFKLYIVPVDHAALTQSIPGTDVLLDSIGNPAAQMGMPQYLLDLNAPCPSICDMTSPIMR